MYSVWAWIKLFINLIPDCFKSRAWLLWESRDLWVVGRKVCKWDFQTNYELIKIHMFVFEIKMKNRNKNSWLGYIFWQ